MRALYSGLCRQRMSAAHLLAVCSAMAAAMSSFAAYAFDFDDVARRAMQLAAAPYKATTANLPSTLNELTYDQFRDIRFKPSAYTWRAEHLPFELAFFHEGLYFKEPVRINEVVDGGVREIKFSPDLFEYGDNKIDTKQLRGLGFAGFRVHYAINTPKYKDEVLVFLGASYFRALGKGQLYGLSARGLAVDTGLPSGEEFPRFVEFWVQRPAANASELTVFALLDSRRLSGAYRFVLKPGVDTAIDVKARLFLREKVGKLGIAPLTSMYFFGENQRPNREDYRPEVHDSDGLSIQSASGEWIWRPLLNPKRLLVTSFAQPNPVGFGLMQRDRNFSHYEDLEARYDLRPSGWVQPKGHWGPGRVELVQIPSPDETNDNIVAYWVPDVQPQPKQPYDFEYRLLWPKDTGAKPPLSWVTQTRRGIGYSRSEDNTIGLIVEFDGPALRKLPDGSKVDAIVSGDANAEVVERMAQKNAVTGGWRVTLRLRRLDDNKPIELRAFLRNGDNTLSETWSYILPPG